MRQNFALAIVREELEGMIVSTWPVGFELIQRKSGCVSLFESI
jgi:hypothetical protein